MKIALTQKFIMITALIIMTSSHPVSEPAVKPPSTNESSLSLQNLSVEQFLSLSKKDFKEMYGDNFTFKHALAFKSLQSELRKSLKIKQITKDQKMNFYQAAKERAFKFNIGGIVLGFLLGLIVVVLAIILFLTKRLH